MIYLKLIPRLRIAGSSSDSEEERDARSLERVQSLDTEVDAIIVYEYLREAAYVLAM